VDPFARPPFPPEFAQRENGEPGDKCAGRDSTVWIQKLRPFFSLDARFAQCPPGAEQPLEIRKKGNFPMKKAPKTKTKDQK
jgi:hypothetical protein